MNIRPGSDFTIAQIAQCSNEAFADYFGHPIVWTPEELAVYLPSHCISRERSLVACPKGSDTPIGFALMAYRDDLPGHGVRLAAPCGRAGRRARADGIETIWLEVITKNASAIKLYARNGFQPVRPLAGWTRDAEPPPPPEGQPALVEEQTPEEVLRLLRQNGAAAADLPWQLWHQFALATRPHSCRGFRLGSAHCAIYDPEDDDDKSKDNDTISLLGVVVAPEARGRGDATALLRAVMARYPGRKWKAPATIPLEYGETIARRLGFTMDTVRMDLMKLSL
ncbi:hypothetical protein MY11210_004251 [Beauveria gryllotalpidicola]